MSRVDSPDGREQRWGPFRFCMQTRVDVADTDLGGIVYYGRYAHFIDRGVIAYRRFLGIPALGPDDHLFVVRHLEVEYRSSARFDEVLDVRVRTSQVGRSSHTMQVAVTRADADAEDEVVTLAEATVTLVGVGGYESPRPTRVPDDIARRLREFDGL